ncbi:MAG TPA: TonB-dependent receptor [Rariglobus sp.]
MHRIRIASLLVISTLAARADDTSVEAAEPVRLEPVTVFAPHVANQEPAATFAMPVSGLRYEPLVDVQARNLAEGQADISIRGGTFENTGFSIGALPIYDPQTGHYFAELPVAPAMLGAPEVRTGTDNAALGWNATAGSVAFGWKPVQAGGYVSAGAGDNALVRGDVYAAYVSDRKVAGRTLAADVDIGASQGDGSRDNGDHDFARYNARLQLRDDVSQTDLFAGYQSKFFGWENLYTATPGLYETENLKTRLFALNHRISYGPADEYFEFGASRRDNSDYYDFNRFSPDPAVPFEHETVVDTAAFSGRFAVAANTALSYRGGVVVDSIDSQRLGAGDPATPSPFGTGRYDDRSQWFGGLFADQTISVGGARELVLKAGANYDDSNRAESSVSPVASATVRSDSGIVRKVYVSYDQSTQLPTYTALNSRPTGLFAGNRDLGRAYARNLELGAEGSCAGWSSHAAVFYRQDDDLVDWTYSLATPNSRRANAVDIDTYGFEATVRRSFSPVDIALGYTFLDKDANYGTGVDASFYALNYAEHRLTAALVARLGAGFEVRMDNEARIQADNALRTRNDEVILSSLGLYYIVPRVKGLTVSAQVDNLWNTYYEEVPLVPGARREVSFGARYAW